jgi:hypothetical protein
VRMKTTLTAAMALSLTTAAAHAQPPPNTSARIEITAASMGPAGNRQGWASGSNDFVIGQRKTHYFFAGDVMRENACSAGQARDGVKSLEALVNENEHVWQVHTTAVEQKDGRFVFDLEWNRYAHASGSRPVLSNRQRLELADGQRHVLDLLHVAAGSYCASVVVDLEVRLREDPARVDEPIQYDLWLVHTDAAGRRQTRHAVMTGLHGQQVPFAFGALRFETPRLTDTQYDFEVVTRVTGDIRGRLHSDGTLQVELASRRHDLLQRRGEDPLTAIPGGAGRKVLTVKPGEAVEIELPVSGGTMGSRLSEQAQPLSGAVGFGAGGGLRGNVSGTPPTEPFLIRGNSYVVNFGPFFEGHRVTLIVQAKRQE